MSPVIKIINPISGSICIDHTARNYVLAKKGTLTSVTKPTVSPPLFVNLDTVSFIGVGGNFACPIIAWRSAARAGIRPPNTRQSASLTSTSVWAFEFWVDAAAGATIDYWIFDLPFNGLAVDSTRVALIAKEASGALLFDSRMRPMRVMGGTANLSSNSNTEQSVNLASLNTNSGILANALSFNGQGFERKSNINYATNMALRWSGDVLYYKYLRTYGTAQAGTNLIGTAIARQLILDVKDY